MSAISSFSGASRSAEGTGIGAAAPAGCRKLGAYELNEKAFGPVLATAIAAADLAGDVARSAGGSVAQAANGLQGATLAGAHTLWAAGVAAADAVGAAAAAVESVAGDVSQAVEGGWETATEVASDAVSGMLAWSLTGGAGAILLGELE
jgi:hypothetical protein